MQIIVFIKQVPDTTDVKLDPKTGNLIREGQDSIINPDDRHALETALELKAAHAARVTVISMGPPQAIDALSEAMGMGADRAILLTDPAFAGADTWATSYTLGKAVETAGEFDLILCGRQAIDGDTAQVGPQVADYLDLPQVSYVYEIESVTAEQLVVKRRLEDGYEKVACRLPAMRGEKIGCFCMTEPEAGSDLGAITTRATEVEDGYLINGMKTWVTDGPEASFYTVLCQTDPAKRLRGIGYFFVPRDLPGVSLSPRFECLGTRTTPICEVAFKDVLVPREYRVTPEGQGLSCFLSILAEIRTMTAALGLGLQRGAMDASMQYTKERMAFGKPISKYQLIQSKIARMATNLGASRLMVYNAAAMIDRGEECMKQATMAKYFATEAACSAADECTRIYAGYGYSMEYPAQRYFRDTRFLLSGGGTHEVLQTNIAKWEGL